MSLPSAHIEQLTADPGQPAHGDGLPIASLSVGRRSWPSRARYCLTAALSRYPLVYVPLVRLYATLLRRHGCGVWRNTEIVIEGFPRSANTFVVEAFELAQGRSVRMAHHVHTTANVLPALRRGLPVLILVRQPDEAILSYHAIWPAIPIGRLFRSYVEFYSRLLPLSERFVVATFDQAIDDMGHVIRRVNERFGTCFREFENTDDNIARCRKRAAMHALHDARKAFLAGPDRLRGLRMRAMRPLLGVPALADIRRQAWDLHDRYAGFASEESWQDRALAIG